MCVLSTSPSDPGGVRSTGTVLGQRGGGVGMMLFFRDYDLHTWWHQHRSAYAAYSLQHFQSKQASAGAERTDYEELL